MDTDIDWQQAARDIWGNQLGTLTGTGPWAVIHETQHTWFGWTIDVHLFQTKTESQAEAAKHDPNCLNRIRGMYIQASAPKGETA